LYKLQGFVMLRNICCLYYKRYIIGVDRLSHPYRRLHNQTPENEFSQSDWSVSLFVE